MKKFVWNNEKQGFFNINVNSKGSVSSKDKQVN